MKWTDLRFEWEGDKRARACLEMGSVFSEKMCKKCRIVSDLDEYESEVVWSVWNSWGKYDHDYSMSFSTYLYMVASRRFNALLRTKLASMWKKGKLVNRTKGKYLVNLKTMTFTDLAKYSESEFGKPCFLDGKATRKAITAIDIRDWLAVRMRGADIEVREGDMLLLQALDGLSINTISKKYRVSETRVHQIISRVKLKLVMHERLCQGSEIRP